MFITRHTLPRRTFLRGMGTAVALPFLDAMTPALARAQSRKAPVRMAFVYVPNGMDMRHWNPDYEGKLLDLPQILRPLEAHKDDILLLSNLTHNTGRALLDGAGDHGRCSGSYLTGVQVKKSVSDIRASVSCDQLVANQIGHQTRFASLEVGLEEAPPHPRQRVVPEVDVSVGERLRHPRIRSPGVKVIGIANVPYVTPIVSARTSREWSTS